MSVSSPGTGKIDPMVPIDPIGLTWSDSEQQEPQKELRIILLIWLFVSLLLVCFVVIIVAARIVTRIVVISTCYCMVVVCSSNSYPCYCYM